MSYSNLDEAAKALAPIFKAMCWKWHGNRVPTEDDIAETLTRLKEDFTKDSMRIESGRLFVERTVDEGVYSFGITWKNRESWIKHNKQLVTE